MSYRSGNNNTATDDGYSRRKVVPMPTSSNSTGDSIFDDTDSNLMDEGIPSETYPSPTTYAVFEKLFSHLAKRHDASKESGEKPVSDYEKLIDRLDQDIRDHKQEVRGRDEQIRAEFQEREKRIHEESKQREERILSAISEMKSDIKLNVTEVKGNVKEGINSLDERMRAIEKHTQSLVMTNLWAMIAGVIAIAAIIVAFFLALPPGTPPTK